MLCVEFYHVKLIFYQQLQMVPEYLNKFIKITRIENRDTPYTWQPLQPSIPTQNCLIESEETITSHDLANIENNTFRVGLVIFSLAKSTKRGNLVHLLTDLYDTKFINQYHQEQKKKLSSKGSQHRHPPNVPHYIESSELTLQMVNFFHYHSVISTDQEKFVLKNTQYRKNRHISSLFRLQILWGIQFQNLKTLNISSQKITSVEGLSFVYLPNLTTLQIHDNKIHSLHSLSKCSMKQLKILSCHENPLIEGELLSRAHFPEIKRYILDSQQFSYNVNSQKGKKNGLKTLQNMDFIFKSESLFKMKELRISSKLRIIPEKLQAKLRDINPRIKLRNKVENQDLMRRIHQFGGVGHTNNPQQYRRFINEEIEPILRNREIINPYQIPMINQIRGRMYQQLRQIQQERRAQQLVAQIPYNRAQVEVKNQMIEQNNQEINNQMSVENDNKDEEKQQLISSIIGNN